MVEHALDRASAAQVAAHLRACDTAFVPSLSGRVDIDHYAGKIATHAARFEAWSAERLVGLVAAYCNAADRGDAFVTSVSVDPAWLQRGIASALLRRCAAHARGLGFARLALEVDAGNAAALALYGRLGFVTASRHADTLHMTLTLERTDQ